MKKLMIYTAGSGSREILLAIEHINQIKPTWDILGFVDEDSNIIGSEIDGYFVFSPDHKELADDVYGICGLLDPLIRFRITEKLILSKGLKLASIISPSLVTPRDFEYGPGTVIMPSVTISFGVKLDAGVIVFWGAALGHHLKVGSYSTILSFATITGNCNIGANVVIGARATLNVGVTIGDNSLVGVGTTVISDVNSNKSVIDLPRRVIRDK